MTKPTITVVVSGLTGTGKSAICGEIEIALKALGIDVSWEASQPEKSMTHGDWAEALETYKPVVLIREVNIARLPDRGFGGGNLAQSKAP